MNGFYLTVFVQADTRAALEKWAKRLVTSGHMAHVIEAGPISGEIVLRDGEPHTLEVRYRFKDRAAYEVYLRDKAEALRQSNAKAIAEFGERLTLTRVTGEILSEQSGSSEH